MSEESLQRARLETDLREARRELERLEDERARLSRKNHLLTEVLMMLRDALPASALPAIDQALAFDGQPWSLSALEASLGDESEEEDDDEADDAPESADAEGPSGGAGAS